MKGNRTATPTKVLTLAEKCKNILASNWQGTLNTVKADSIGSKEEIYSSKVKYFVKRGRPYIWVPENDLHNVNTVIDERGSLAVTSPLPGSLASLLQSLKKPPNRIALVGEVVPLSDDKIIGFHNCLGCARKVKDALRKIGGVELVKFYPESGNVTVSTAKHPEVIRYALERKINKSVVIMSQEIVVADQNRSDSVESHHQILADSAQQLTSDLHELLKLSRDGLDSMEVTRSTTIKVKFNHRSDQKSEAVSPKPRGNIGNIHMDDADVVEYETPRPLPRAPPWSATEPSAPPEEEVVYGYPPEFYGFSATRSHDNLNGRCTII